MRLLDDHDVSRLITPRLAVDAARDALVAAHRGTLTAPARSQMPAGATDYTFTVGGLADGPSGFRVYGRWPEDSDQLVAVWRPEGRLDGIVTGHQLGPLRTGALGAVALDVLAPTPLEILAVVGTGVQAWTQLWAATAVREPGLVRVTSRHAQRREAFARRAREELGLTVEAVAQVRETVDGAQSVICATTSEVPVLEAAWLAAGCHVTSVGPKFPGRCELPDELVREAELRVTDSPAQLAAFGNPVWDVATVVHVGAIAAGDARVPTSENGIRLYASVGLAGSEVLLAHRLLETYRFDASREN